MATASSPYPVCVRFQTHRVLTFFFFLSKNEAYVLLSKSYDIDIFNPLLRLLSNLENDNKSAHDILHSLNLFYSLVT